MNPDRAARPLGVLLRLLYACLVVAALGVDAALYSRSEGPRELVLGVAAVGVCGMAWARWPQHALPLAFAAASVSLYVTSQPIYGYYPSALFTEAVVLAVLFGACLASRTWMRWPVALYSAVAGELLARRASEELRWVIGLAMLTLLGAAVAAVVYIRLRDNERTMSIERARQSERLELARELHDVVGHHVTGIVVLAQARRFTAASRGAVDPVHDQTLAEIENAGLETMTSIRRLVGMLRADAATTTGPQLTDIQRVVADLQRTHPHVELFVDAEMRQRWVPAELATTVQRLVQETATNIRKHGDPARPAMIELRREAGVIEVRASNAPLGGPRGNGYGLVGMRERVEALGGTFVSGLDGNGQWVVRCTLPLAAPKVGT